MLVWEYVLCKQGRKDDFILDVKLVEKFAIESIVGFVKGA